MIDEKRIIRSYARRRSRGLSNLQKDSLSNLYGKFGIQCPLKFDNQIDNASKLSPRDFFSGKFDRLIIEIGFGMGEHLIQNAILNSKDGFIGCEPFENGVANALKEINEHKIDNAMVFNGDARLLVNLFQNSSVDRFYILFPDPWPKKKHHKRRLLSTDFVSVLSSKLKSNGDIIFATDCKAYMDMVLGNIENIPSIEIKNASLERPDWFIKTRYEEKALSREQRPYYAVLGKTEVIPTVSSGSV